MLNVYLVTIVCPDRTGLVSSIAGTLFELGINLGSTNFAVLGGGSEFTAVCTSESGAGKDVLKEALAALPDLQGATIQVTDFEFDTTTAPNADVTHRITIQGGDHPGLVATLTETFVEFDANIVRLNADCLTQDGSRQYLIQIAAWIPPDREHACLASISNTASSLRMQCSYSKIHAAAVA
jgi:glycine cleavage system transcriptional repressor